MDFAFLVIKIRRWLQKYIRQKNQMFLMFFESKTLFSLNATMKDNN